MSLSLRGPAKFCQIGVSTLSESCARSVLVLLLLDQKKMRRNKQAR